MSEITNEAIFRGKIVGMRGGNANGTITLACPFVTTLRKEGKTENEARTNFPAMMYTKYTSTENVHDNFKVGDHVVVKASVRAQVRMDEHTGEVRESIGIYINDILHDRGKMMDAFGVEGGPYHEPQNEVYLSGSLEGITRRNATAQIRLNLSDERRNIVNAMYFHAPENKIRGLSIGDRVNILAMVQTVDTKDKDKENKKARNYQDLVVLGLSVDK